MGKRKSFEFSKMIYTMLNDKKGDMEYFKESMRKIEEETGIDSELFGELILKVAKLENGTIGNIYYLVVNEMIKRKLDISYIK